MISVRDIRWLPSRWLLATLLGLQPLLTVAAPPCDTGERQGEDLPLLRLPPEAALSLQHSGLDEAGRIVVRDRGAWEDLWRQVQGARQPLPPVPDVDFDHHLVVLTAMGRQHSGGYSIRVERALQQAGKVVVTVREESPGPGCIVMMGMTSPIDVVLLPATADAVEFCNVPVVRRCD